MKRYFLVLIISTIVMNAAMVEIVRGMPFVEVEANGKMYKIERIQKKNSYLTNTFALTSRPSPPFFIEPFSVNKNIETYGELELLDFISHQSGIFIDARLSNWYEESAIPTAINIPFKLFLKDSKERNEILMSLGAKKTNNVWDFKNVRTILFYCNGAWCGQSPTAINALIDLGYPKKKMKYYRGGMQSWQLLGLTTVMPKDYK